MAIGNSPENDFLNLTKRLIEQVEGEAPPSLTLKEEIILNFLSKRRSATATKIKFAFNLEAYSLSRIIRSLTFYNKEEGREGEIIPLIVDKTNPADRRRKIISITFAGKKVLEKVFLKRTERLKKSFGSLNKKERKTLITLLKKMAEKNLNHRPILY